MRHLCNTVKTTKRLRISMILIYFTENRKKKSVTNARLSDLLHYILSNQHFSKLYHTKEIFYDKLKLVIILK